MVTEVAPLGIKIIFIDIIIIIYIAALAVRTPGTKRTVKNKKAAPRTARRTAPVKTLKDNKDRYYNYKELGY